MYISEFDLLRQVQVNCRLKLKFYCIPRMKLGLPDRQINFSPVQFTFSLQFTLHDPTLNICMSFEDLV